MMSKENSLFLGEVVESDFMKAHFELKLFMVIWLAQSWLSLCEEAEDV